MEYTQWVLSNSLLRMVQSLNPCCNGIYSMSRTSIKRSTSRAFVLILVVMEYTQWVIAAIPMLAAGLVLILVVMEYTQWVFVSLFSIVAQLS